MDKTVANRAILFFPMLLQGTYWGMLKVALPVLPHLSNIFHTSSHFIHLMLSLSFILSGLSSIIWGPLTNGINNRQFIFHVMIVGVFFMITLSLVQSFLIFFILYIASCVLINSFSVYSRAFAVLYLPSPDSVKKSLSLRLFGGYTAAFLAPLMSGFICHYYDWRYSFYIVIFLLIFVYLVAWCIKDKKSSEERHSFLTDINAMKQHFKNKKFLYYLVILCCANGVTQSYLISTPFWLEDAYHVSMRDIGFYLFPLLFPGMRLPFLPAYIARHVSERKRTIMYVSVFIFAALLPFFLIQLEKPPAWVWVMPGFFAGIGGVGLTPFITYNGLAQLESSRHAGSTILSVFSYLSGGVAMYFTLKIRIEDFYLEGIFMVSIALLMCYMIKKTGQLEI